MGFIFQQSRFLYCWSLKQGSSFSGGFQTSSIHLYKQLWLYESHVQTPISECGWLLSAFWDKDPSVVRLTCLHLVWPPRFRLLSSFGWWEGKGDAWWIDPRHDQRWRWISSGSGAACACPRTSGRDAAIILWPVHPLNWKQKAQLISNNCQRKFS